MNADTAAKTGDPAVLQAQAQAWNALAAALRDHGTGLQTQLARSQAGQDWSGTGAEAFHHATTGVTDRAAALSSFCQNMALTMDQHAHQQKQISDILEEIAVQIAALLAYTAAAALFPPLVATAQAYIATLVAQGNRMLALLAQILTALTRWLASARAALHQLSSASWRGESFSFAYGRALVEGTRDFAIELAATSTASAITGTPINPEHLFTNALISFGVGGVFGAATHSGLSKQLNGAGEIVRTPDGRPAFTAFSSQIDSAVQSLRWNPRGQRTPPPQRDQALLRLETARADIRELGLRAHPGEHRRLADQARAAHQRAADTRENLATARTAVQDAENTAAAATTALQAARTRAQDTEHQLWNAESLLALHQRSQNQSWREDAEAFARQARTEHDTATRQLSTLQEQHDNAVHALHTARDSQDAALRELEQAENLLDEPRRYLAAVEEFQAAATRFNMHGTFTDRLRELWRHNDWRDSFGTAKPWQSVLFHEAARDAAKGAVASAAQSAAGIANGSREPGTTGRDVLFATVAGGLRGAAIGATGNRAFPDTGIEDLLFRTGLKSTESFTRQQITKP